LIGLAASAPAQAGFRMNGFMLNGFMLNGFMLNGFMLNGRRVNGPDQPVGFNFNALTVHAVVLPTDAQ
jgi:hypothetical protein